MSVGFGDKEQMEPVMRRLTCEFVESMVAGLSASRISLPTTLLLLMRENGIFSIKFVSDLGPAQPFAPTWPMIERATERVDPDFFIAWAGFLMQGIAIEGAKAEKAFILDWANVFHSRGVLQIEWTHDGLVGEWQEKSEQSCMSFGLQTLFSAQRYRLTDQFSLLRAAKAMQQLRPDLG